MFEKASCSWKQKKIKRAKQTKQSVLDVFLLYGFFNRKNSKKPLKIKFSDVEKENNEYSTYFVIEVLICTSLICNPRERFLP